MKNLTITSDENLVLVVDDEADIRSLLSIFLNRENIPNITAASVKEAVQILKTKKVSVVLLDWSLRGSMDCSGADILSYCKEHFPLTPVIVMSGRQYDVSTDAIVKGADGFLPKPFNSIVVGSLISTWLKRVKATPKVFLPDSKEGIRSLENIKTAYIKHVVQILGCNISEAAKKLDVHRQTVSSALNA